jgi:hypothetical protein
MVKYKNRYWGEKSRRETEIVSSGLPVNRPEPMPSGKITVYKATRQLVYNVGLPMARLALN